MKRDLEELPNCICEWNQEPDPDCPVHGIGGTDDLSKPKTPLTDKLASDGWSGDAECVSAEDARKLETMLSLAEGALVSSKRQIETLAENGTDRIVFLGGDCDPWQKTADITIRRAGIEDTLAKISELKATL